MEGRERDNIHVESALASRDAMYRVEESGEQEPLFDHRMKAAYYNHASEKSISHAEAKMIYHRHILENSDHEAQETPRRVKTLPPVALDGEWGRVRSGM